MKAKTSLKLSSVVVALFLAGAVFSGCQKATTPTPTSGSTSQDAAGGTLPAEGEKQSASEITISGSAFGPTPLIVKAGSTVTVTNKDVAGHSVTSDDGKSFDTDILSKDQTKTFTAPTAPGTYTYHCTAHPSMKGTLIVD